MSSLSGSPDLPGVNAKLIARKGWRRINWKLEIRMSGPDGRYTSANTSLSGPDALFLASLLEKALKQIVELNSKSFSGTYQRIIGRRSGIKVSVYGPYFGEMTARIQMETETRVFSRYLSKKDTIKWMNELHSIPLRGEQVIKTLKKMK